MASGHVNRIKRPNTWLHRPMLQNVKKALANSEPSTHGTKRTCRCSRRMSVVGVTTEVGFQFCVWSSGGGWRGRGASWSIVAAGRFPAFLHF